jgi:sulfur carrier protein
MQVTVNGAMVEVDDGVTVADLVRSRVAGHRRVAVAHNGTVVPRSAWDETRLRLGDSVEVLAPVAGG